jgi:hypothetical protein
MDYLTLVDRKLNPPPASAQANNPFARRQAPLSEDAKSELRGELVTLRADIRKAIPRTTNRETQLHLEGADHRIGDILDPKK